LGFPEKWRFPEKWSSTYIAAVALFANNTFVGSVLEQWILRVSRKSAASIQRMDVARLPLTARWIQWRLRLLADCLQVLLLVQCANNGSYESGGSVVSIQRMDVARRTLVIRRLHWRVRLLADCLKVLPLVRATKWILRVRLFGCLHSKN